MGTAELLHREEAVRTEGDGTWARPGSGLQILIAAWQGAVAARRPLLGATGSCRPGEAGGFSGPPTPPGHREPVCGRAWPPGHQTLTMSQTLQRGHGEEPGVRLRPEQAELWGLSSSSTATQKAVVRVTTRKEQL